MKIYLLRHGESIDDIEDCYGGIADFPLTKAGRKTAEELGNKLSTSEIKKIFSSPYKRAYETATIVSNILNCDVEIINELRERNSYGVMSGVNKDKAKKIFPIIFESLKGKPGYYYSDELIPGAEPIHKFDDRVKSAFQTVLEEARDLDIVGIVTHGNVTRSIYRNILSVQGIVELDLSATTIIQYVPAKIIIESKSGIKVVDQ